MRIGSFLVHVVVVAVALWVSTLLVPGIVNQAVGLGPRIVTFLVVGLIFGLVNAIIKPIVKTVGCAFYVLTLGLIGLVVNALLFLLVEYFADTIGLAFSVDGFTAAFFGAIVVAVVSFLLHLVIPDSIDAR